MQFKIDENLPIEAARLLAQAGHEAKTVHEQQLVGRPDDQVVAVCHDEGRALVTIDLDFADIAIEWTLCAILKSEHGGLGLDVARDNGTRGLAGRDCLLRRAAAITMRGVVPQLPGAAP